MPAKIPTPTEIHRDEPSHVFDQFAAIRLYQPGLTFSPDGSEIAYVTNTSGQFNLWRQSSSGGYPHQLTSFEDQAVRQIAWSPDGETILFTADRDGDEMNQAYRIPAAGGWPEALTDLPAVQHYLADGDAWSPDGRTVAYAGNDRSPTDQDVIVRDLNGGEVGRPIARDGVFSPVFWSPDGASLTVIEAHSNMNLDIHLVSLADGNTRCLTSHEGEVKFIPGPWAPDGSGFYLLTDEDREFIGVAFLDVASGERRWLETPDWDVEDLALSPDGRYLAWVVNQEGYSRLSLRDLTTGQLVQLPAIPDGTISIYPGARSVFFTPSSDKLGFLMAQPRHPAEVFVLDLAAHTLTQLTHGAMSGIPDAQMVGPEVVQFPTFDGHQISAFLYRPAGDGPFPAVLSIHGGPEAQELPRYFPLYQYLLSRGIAVLAPNIRGSTGYGKTYQRLIHRDWGGGDLRDFESCVEFLRDLDWIDRERLGVYGGSYGGFATLTCVTRLPDVWAAAVEIVGPANLVTFAKAVPPTWRRFMAEWVGDPETEEAFLMERSPITYVDRITAPLFVIQGANDPRVVKSESDQIVERLRARGVAVRYDIYEDEGHGFTRRSNQLRAMRDTAAFFEERLLPNAD